MGYRYIGSKARIANSIIDYVGLPQSEDSVFIDAFSGTGAVASAAADHGWKILINDMMLNATIVSEAHLISEEDVDFHKLGSYHQAIQDLSLAQKKGFIWREYSPASKGYIGIERRYFTEVNAQKIDGAVSLIYDWKSNGLITKKEFSLLMASLIYAVNDVANIAGTYGCFLSRWTPQANNGLKIEPLPIRKHRVDYSVTNVDVFEVISKKSDIVYLDPPYTKRQYASYYHILETIVNGDEPSVEGVAGLRPWKDNSSIFCYKTKALEALVKLIISQNAERVIVSYSNDGHINLDELAKELDRHGNVIVVELGSIGRYRPNQAASSNGSIVKEYLIDFKR